MARGRRQEETVPGFRLSSANFVVTFVAGFQEGSQSDIIEEETNWRLPMLKVLDILESFPDSLEKIEDEVGKVLERWVASHEVAENLGIEARVHIKEMNCEDTPLAPQGANKMILVNFTDEFQTQAIFHIEKKRSMLTLKDLGVIEVLDKIVQEEIAIKRLGVPKTLMNDLINGCRNYWSPRHHRRNSTDCC